MQTFLDASYWIKYDIVSHDKLNEYLSLITNILKIGNRELDYTERHHIVPKSFDASLSNDKSNIVALTGREHFIAHHLLAQCFRGEYGIKMSAAFLRMCGSPQSDCYVITPDEYEEARRLCGEKMKSRHLSEEAKHKLSVLKSARIVSEDTRKKISDFAKTRTGKSNPFFGHKHTDEAIENMRQIKIQNQSWAGSNNPMYGLRGGKAPQARRVICEETGEVFDSILDAAQKYNTTSPPIIACCKGRTKTSAGKHWRYL